MAGSKTFLQPILDETVGGIQEAVDDVVEVVQPIPDKIDEQIASLEAVVQAIGSTAAALSVKSGDEILIHGVDKSMSRALSTSNYLIQTINAQCSGTLKLHIVGTMRMSAGSNYPHFLAYQIGTGTVKTFQTIYDAGTGIRNFDITYDLTGFQKGDVIYIYYRDDETRTSPIMTNTFSFELSYEILNIVEEAFTMA